MVQGKVKLQREGRSNASLNISQKKPNVTSMFECTDEALIEGERLKLAPPSTAHMVHLTSLYKLAGIFKIQSVG